MQNVSRPIIIDIFICRLKYRSITFIQLSLYTYIYIYMNFGLCFKQEEILTEVIMFQ